ncbi:GUN4 domain-containing protein [Dolichospermum circinale CS-1225]|uniref:GUN4 domain-containing protein n=1 Tax=Dolichospermum circinale CS-537/01 TaxID=3021739 RepID=A0ABT5A474_9CYAN|nr:GUN4 domain-containing protein [Dolichospermum circinale]MDB9457125.1 GUN4 domain-containing protein [Dolichospermum circinale CS-545/17]MDB9486736.1 GUN4 domain-containing protein [Dolichospermum circinale CS-537/01]MDB9520598.1 GUN4 domain-containing protein [Dolichospermum circinale CS-1225]
MKSVTHRIIDNGALLVANTPYLKGFRTLRLCVKLGDRVGWRRNNEWLSYESHIFSTNALQGHLPRLGIRKGFYTKSWIYLLYSFFLSRL